MLFKLRETSISFKLLLISHFRLIYPAKLWKYIDLKKTCNLLKIRPVDLDFLSNFLKYWKCNPTNIYLIKINNRDTKKMYEKFSKLTTKTPEDVIDLRPVTLLKERLWCRCFPENFVKFLRTTFSTEHLRWLLFKSVVSIFSVIRENVV